MARKAIFISGGASGIGRAVARFFAARDWCVGLADLDTPGMQETAAPIPVGLMTTYVMDVRDRANWDHALLHFVDLRGRIDVLFNNAGVAVAGPFAITPAEELDRIIAVNFAGVVNGAWCGHRFLKATPGSCLLNTASAAALYGTAGGAIYSATKFAVRGLTEALDAEWANDGIRVRSLMPSFIDTPMLETPVQGTKLSTRDRVNQQRLEITPAEQVAEAAWRAVHGDAIHTVVGKTARRVGFAARWMPGALRKRMRERA